MSARRKPYWVLAVLLASAASVSCSEAAPAEQTAAPPSAARVSPHRSVTIYRDAMGVPHILGSDSSTVLFGLGYAFAQDRLAQIEFGRRGVEGRRAEILGSSAVASDRTARERLLPPDELMRMYDALPAEHQQMMQAFVDGLNRRISQVNRDPDHLLPFEFKQWGIKPRPWTLLDHLAYVASFPHDRGGYELQNLAFLSAMIAKHGPQRGRAIFEDVVPLTDPDSPTTIPAGEDLAPSQPMPASALNRFRAPSMAANLAPAARAPRSEASRCLVIGPARSASGHVLMMEATADGPEAHLQGGGFDTAGFAFPAWGPPIMGRSLQHGWLMTSGQADTTITYAEKLNPADKYQYWFKGAWREMAHRSEVIQVKDASPVEYEVAATVHGPVIEWDEAQHIAYSERYASRGRELDNWVGQVEMARAKTLAEFQDKGVARLAWNLGICYGDAAGQFGFWEAGIIPKRPAGADPRLPTPGTGEYEWTESLTFAERPHMLNPKQGYIHTWNSKATSWSREGNDARIGKTFRTWAGSEWAASSDAVTLLDMRDINRKIFNAMGAQDRTQTSPAFFAPYIRRAADRTSDPDVKRAADLMLSFNGRYEDLDRDGKYDNPGLTLFRQWLQTAPQIVFGAELGEWWWKVDADRYLKYQTSLLLRALQGRDAGLPMKVDYFNGRDRDGVIIETIRQTIEKVRPQFAGSDMAQWRLPVFWKYFDPERETPDRPALPGDETGGTVRTAARLGLIPPAVRHHGGEEWVGLMELNPKSPVLYSVVEAGGQSLFIDAEGKGNPHLADQLAMHAENEFKRIDLSAEGVRKDAASVTTLEY